MRLGLVFVDAAGRLQSLLKILEAAAVVVIVIHVVLQIFALQVAPALVAVRT